jgi:hypothetical protein
MGYDEDDDGDINSELLAHLIFAAIVVLVFVL